MDNYRVINKELTQRNQELRQTIGILTKEKSDLMQRVMALEQINFKLKNSFNTILEATQSYSGVLQTVYSDYQNLIKRSTGSWCSNGMDNSKRPSQHFRDTTNLSNRRTYENLTKNSDESNKENLEYMNKSNKLIPMKTTEIDKENVEEPVKSPIISKFVSTRKKKLAPVHLPSEDMEIEEENISLNDDIDDPPSKIPEENPNNDDQNEAEQNDMNDESPGGLYPIPEESTIRSELSITVVKTKSEQKNISGIDSLPEDKASPDDDATLKSADLSKGTRKTSYSSNVMQLTNVEEDDNAFEDFSLSKISSSTPYKRRSSTSNIYPKVVIKRLTRSSIADITANATSIKEETSKSSSSKKSKGRKRSQKPKTKTSKSPKTNQSPRDMVNCDRPRRRAAPASLAEPKLNTKLRKF